MIPALVLTLLTGDGGENGGYIIRLARQFYLPLLDNAFRHTALIVVDL